MAATTERWIPEPMTFADRLVAVRAHLRLSTAEVARRIGVSDVTLGSWENGASQRVISQAQLAQRYEEEFGVDRNWLLYGAHVSSQVMALVSDSQPRLPGLSLPAAVEPPALEAVRESA